MKIIFQIFILILFCLVIDFSAAKAGQGHGVILVYFQIVEDIDFSDGVRLETFQKHLDILESENFNVMALPELIKTLDERARLPDKTVVLTFENSTREVLEIAAPLLAQKNFPYTVFLATDNWGNKKDRDYLKRLSSNTNVNFGIHTADYILQNDIKKFSHDLNRAKGEFTEIFGQRPEFFSFPFGLYNSQHRAVIEQHRFSAVLGQSSGVAWQRPQNHVYPRFTMSESYASPDRLRIVASALPFNAIELTPEETLITNRSPLVGFTLKSGISQNQIPGCFLSNQGRVPVEQLNELRFEIRPKLNSPDLRYRLNCTLKVSRNNQNVRWRWLGFLLELEQEAFTQTDEPQ
jgi:peptidoglycan/xylan/chitin deacetylase (PgdA/CDA1 family)